MNCLHSFIEWSSLLASKTTDTCCGFNFLYHQCHIYDSFTPECCLWQQFWPLAISWHLEVQVFFEEKNMWTAQIVVICVAYLSIAYDLAQIQALWNGSQVVVFVWQSSRDAIIVDLTFLYHPEVVFRHNTPDDLTRSQKWSKMANHCENQKLILLEIGTKYII